MLDDCPRFWTSAGMLHPPSDQEEEEARRLVSPPQEEAAEAEAVAVVAASVSLPLLELVQPPLVALRLALDRRLRKATLRSRVLALADGAALNGRLQRVSV